MEDLISRQQAIDEGMSYINGDCFCDKEDFAKYIEFIEQLPSAEPERIKARWVLAENQRPEDMENENYLFICSNCGSTDLHSKRVPVPYCWNCGAEMLREVTE